jgi:hypothetical protein
MREIGGFEPAKSYSFPQPQNKDCPRTAQLRAARIRREMDTAPVLLAANHRPRAAPNQHDDDRRVGAVAGIIIYLPRQRRCAHPRAALIRPDPKTRPVPTRKLTCEKAKSCSLHKPNPNPSAQCFHRSRKCWKPLRCVGLRIDIEPLSRTHRHKRGFQ